MKKLEELFDLPTTNQTDDIDDLEAVDDDVSQTETVPVISNSLTELDKISEALPAVRNLEASDSEMDDLASRAVKSFDDLMDLGMNVDSRFSSEIFSVASSMLGHAITAKNAKVNKKLKMIELQLKKANLDRQLEKDKGIQTENGVEETSTGMVLDRNALLDRLLGRNSDNSNNE